MSPQERSELEAAYPGWHVWQTAKGTPMATRRKDLTPEETRAGLDMTLMDDWLGGPLVEQLAKQSRIEQDRMERSGS